MKSSDPVVILYWCFLTVMVYDYLGHNEGMGERNLNKYLGPMLNMFIVVTFMVIGATIGFFFGLWDSIGRALGLY